MVALIASIAPATFTLIHCRNRWQFVLIAIWKICLSATLSLATVTAAFMSKVDHLAEPPARKDIARSTIWLALYVVGLTIGLMGVGTWVKETWDNHTIRLITYAFGGICGGLILIPGVGSCCTWVDGHEDVLPLVYMGPIALAAGGIVMLGVLYSDWILAVIAGNLAGVPSPDILILYWAYFAAKRLPKLNILMSGKFCTVSRQYCDRFTMGLLSYLISKLNRRDRLDKDQT
jgi:hypothetical protein